MINLDEIKESTYLAREGDIPVKITKVEFSESKNGNPTHKFTCESAEGEETFVYLTLTDKSLWKYKKFLKALGHPGTGSIDPEAVSRNCVGKKFIAVMKKGEPYLNPETGLEEESKIYKVDDFKPLPKNEPKPVDNYDDLPF